VPDTGELAETTAFEARHMFNHRFFVARDLRGDAAFFDVFDFARTRSGSFLAPVSRFHSSKV
jgi:hypothetical protein